MYVTADLRAVVVRGQHRACRALPDAAELPAIMQVVGCAATMDKKQQIVTFQVENQNLQKFYACAWIPTSWFMLTTL